MSTILANATNGLGTGPGYFRSFASYEIPFRPDEPVEDFAGTEGLKSFYRAYFDAGGRVRQFDKLLMVRSEEEDREFKLSADEKPGSTVYFEVVRDPLTRVPGIGKRLTYPETEQLPEFFAGEVDSLGKACRVLLLGREISFSDTYEYWPTGRLRTRSTTKKDSPASLEHYGKGRSLAGLGSSLAGLAGAVYLSMNRHFRRIFQWPIK
jgi:hypothetical protein